MNRPRPHSSPDDIPNVEDTLDEALERFVRGDREALTQLDPEMRATVDEMYRWANESGFRNTPQPGKSRRSLRGGRWSPLLSGLAAAVLVGIILYGGFLIFERSRDDPPSEEFQASNGGDLNREPSRMGEDGSLTQEEANLDIYLAFGEYKWPDSYMPTATDIVNSFSPGDTKIEDSPDHRYAPGIGHGVVGNWHSCAWYMAWLDAYRAGDHDAEAEALAVMTNVLPYHPNYHESTRQQRIEIAERAADDDSSLVVRRIELDNCEDRSFRGSTDTGRGGTD